MWRSSRGLVPASPTFQKKHEKNEILSCLRGKHKRTHTHTKRKKKKKQWKGATGGGSPQRRKPKYVLFRTDFFSFFQESKRQHHPAKVPTHTHPTWWKKMDGERDREIFKKKRVNIELIHCIFFSSSPGRARLLPYRPKNDEAILHCWSRRKRRLRAPWRTTHPYPKKKHTHTPYTLVNEKKQNKTTTGYGKKNAAVATRRREYAFGNHRGR